MKTYLLTLMMIAPALHAQVAPAVLPAATAAQNDDLIRRAWASNDQSLRQLIQNQMRSPRGALALQETQFRTILTNRLAALNRAQVPYPAGSVGSTGTEAGYCIPCEIAALHSRLASLEAVAASTPYPSAQYAPSPQPSYFDHQNAGADGLSLIGMLSSFSQVMSQNNSGGYFSGGYQPRPYYSAYHPANYGLSVRRPYVLPAMNSYSVASYRTAAPAILPFR